MRSQTFKTKPWVLRMFDALVDRVRNVFRRMT